MAATSNVKERAIHSGVTRQPVPWKPFRGTPRYPTFSRARFIATYPSQRSERRRRLSNNALKLRSIQRFLALTGGLKRRIKERSPLRLSLADREELSRGLVAGDSLQRIATRLRRAPSTISREVAWSGSRNGYRAWRADREAIKRGQRPKPAKLAVDARLCREVERGLRAEWSPQQIAARLICDYPDDLATRDDLQDAVRPGSWSAAQGAHGLPSDGTDAAASAHAD